MSTFDSKTCLVILAATLAVGACAPVSNSASKFAASVSGSGGSTQNVSSTPDTAASSVSDSSIQTTEVVSEDTFEEKWPEISVKRPSMLLDANEHSVIKASFRQNIAAEFQSSDARVEGSEATLVGPRSKVRIFLIVKSDSKAKSLQLSDIKMRLVWVPKAKDVVCAEGACAYKDRHWQLVVENPSLNSDDPAAATHAETVRKLLLRNLSGIAIEFEAAEAHSPL